MPDLPDNPLDGRGSGVPGTHTPGPWRAGGTHSGLTYAIRHNGGGAPIATVFADTGRLMEDGVANAALIAAAPAMLAALRLALPELREDLEALVDSSIPLTRRWTADEPLPDDLDEDVVSMVTVKKAAYDAVVAAIAAAEGRTPFAGAGVGIWSAQDVKPGGAGG